MSLQCTLCDSPSIPLHKHMNYTAIVYNVSLHIVGIFYRKDRTLNQLGLVMNGHYKYVHSLTGHRLTVVVHNAVIAQMVATQFYVCCNSLIAGFILCDYMMN